MVKPKHDYNHLTTNFDNLNGDCLFTLALILNFISCACYLFVEIVIITFKLLAVYKLKVVNRAKLSVQI